MERETYVFAVEEEREPVEEGPTLAAEPLFSTLLRDAIQRLWPEDAVMADFVEDVVPSLSDQLGHKGAKGGDFVVERRRAGEEVAQRYIADQSMRAHVINGLLPVLHVARTLQAWGAPRFRYCDDVTRRCFIAGYVLHDYLKLPGVEADLEAAGFDHKAAVGAQQMPVIESIFGQWCTALGLDAFLAPIGGVERVLHDLIYIASNTQKRWGTLHNLSLLPRLELTPAQLSLAEQLSTLADYLAYIAPNPRAAAANSSIQRELAQLSRRTARLTYHHIADNKGVLTNFVHNAALRAMQDDYRVPLLYAPSGVVYVEQIEKAPPPPQVEIIIDRGVREIQRIVGWQLRTSLDGFSRAGKGLKYADYYWLFFDLLALIRLGPRAVFKIINESKTPSAGKRFAKIREKGWMMADVELDLPDEIRVDQLAEWAYLAEKQVREKLPGFDTASVLLREMELLHLAPQFEAVPRDNRAGGVGYHWYFAAGHYTRRHPGLDPAAWRERIEGFAEALAAAVATAIEQEPEVTDDPWSDLRAYISRVLTLGPHRGATQPEEQGPAAFAAELHRYQNAKRKGHGTTQMCSLCSSAYQVEQQRETAVLFAPQVYSNKLLLHGTTALRDICSICSLEMMLRQNLMVRSSVSGGRFEGRRVRYLYFYPTYYFTPETLHVLRRVYSQLRRVSFTELRRQLVSKEGAVALEATIWQRLEPLLLEPEDQDEADDRYVRMHFPEDMPITFHFLGVPPPGRDANDTESWVHPAFLALLLPLCIDVKVVASESPLPLFLEADDLSETVFLDGPHAAIRYLTGGQLSVNVDQVLPTLQRLAVGYLIHTDANTAPGSNDFYRWQDLPALARGLDTSPLYVFHYLKKWQRRQRLDTIPASKAHQYLTYAQHFMDGGTDMSHAKRLTELYRQFYRARRRNANSILRPISIAAKAVLDANSQLFDAEGVVEAVYGELRSYIERGRRESLFYFPRGSTGESREGAMKAFARHFVNEVFHGALRGDKSALRGKQLNLLKSACEVIYREADAEEWAGSGSSTAEHPEEEEDDDGSAE